MQESMMDLLKVTFPPGTEKITLNNYNVYFQKQLNMRIGVGVMDDAEIQVELNRMPNKNVFRLNELLTRFNKSRSIKCKNEVMHFLIRVTQTYQPCTLDILFKKENSTLETNVSQISTLKRSTMEIESIPSTVRNQNGQSDYLKQVKLITDKGNQLLNLTEQDLLKDLIFALQGIETQTIIYDPIQDVFALKKDIAVSIPTRKIINIISEAGWLFKKISVFLNTPTLNLVLQALQASIKSELNEYYRLIAYFENMLPNAQLSLRQVYHWMREPMVQLTQINLVLSTLQTTSHSGAVSALSLSTLQLYEKHGCPIISSLFQRMLKSACLPFVRWINQWVFDGTFDDAAGELFVEREETKMQIRDYGELWRREFRVNEKKVPSIISLNDAYKIHDTGRVVNWLRKQCNCKTWQLQQELATIEMFTTPRFSEWVLKANQETNAQLVSLLFNQFKFQMHLQAIKRYLLLGQGEFIHTLMEMIQQELNKPAVNIYKHNLLALLESAIRSSNVQYLPAEVNHRLSVKLLEPSQNDTGWEVFCLDYRIDEPLNTIFNGKAMLVYLRIFNFLWRVKRVEYTLCQCWREHIKIFIPKDLKQLKQAFNLSHKMLNEMQHFIKNLYSYIMVEAIESAWKKFVDECETKSDLDSLIRLHEAFQTEILERAFLTPKTEGILKFITRLFELIFRFKTMQECLLSLAKEILEIYKQDQLSQKIHEIIQAPRQTQRPSFKGEEIIKSLRDLNKQYRDHMFQLQDKLRQEDRLKFLHFKLDFNEYYQSLKDRPIFDQNLDVFLGNILPVKSPQDLDITKLAQQKSSSSSKNIIPNPVIHQQGRAITAVLPNTQPDSSQKGSLNKGAHTPSSTRDHLEQVRSVKQQLQQLDESRKKFLQQGSASRPLTEHEKRKNDDDSD